MTSSPSEKVSSAQVSDDSFNLGQGTATESGRRFRLIAFIVLSTVAIGLAATGVLGAGSDVEITSDEAIDIARAHLDFEPVNADARLVRQGARLRPVWGVSFSIPADDNPRELIRHTTVELDAKTGQVLRIGVDEEGQLDTD